MRVKVPVVRQRWVDVPSSIINVVQRKFRCGCEQNEHLVLVAADFDATLVDSLNSYSHKSPIRGAAVEPPIMTLLRENIPFVVITAARQEEMQRRLIDPIRESLIEEGNLEFLRNLTVYANLGAIRSSFTEKGEVVANGVEEYREQFVIPEEDQEVLESTMREIGWDFWGKYTRNPMTMTAQYPGFGFREPKVEIQGGVKLTLSPLPGEARPEYMWLIQQKLRQQGSDDLAVKYRIAPGGRTTIDVTSSQLHKGTALQDAMRRFGMPHELPEHVIYFGDSFVVAEPDGYGRINEGNDVPVLRLGDAVIPIGVNENQDELKKMQRVIPGGSGPRATAAWLAYFVRKLLDAIK